MTFLKFAAILFIVLNFTISIILVKLLRLQKKGGNFADIAFPLFVFEFYLITDKAYYHSLLPHLFLALSILTIAIACIFLWKRKDFTYSRFFKLFWRAGFLLTFLIYLAMTISLFLM
ncbi:DUF3397 domain-containing protein [Streptococcus minor]|uniref:DUF3397 domain-containing protein n=1 Tax=Streptococcus minor TaxID=229549 RepID=A0A3P1VHH6_9STRE|nr:DUF3397 domain-containing protein [Streptococcus minor]RRD31833.1 DUF3397 domain-containing protein [Streptococcus minor]